MNLTMNPTGSPTSRISASTRFCALLGDPVRHSLSPMIHNRWYKEHGIDAVYLALPVAKGQVAQTLRTLAATKALGANITVPHKLEALKACDGLTDEARQVGAVNSVMFQESGMIGDNTDAQGFAQDLRKRASRFSFAKVCLWGAGGAAQAVLVALKGLGTKEVLIINRTQEKAESLVRSFNEVFRKESQKDYQKDSQKDSQKNCQKNCQKNYMALQATTAWHERVDFVSTSDLFINASTQGMKGIALDESYFPNFASVVQGGFSEKLAYDLIYNPTRTAFLESARKANIQTLGGIGMLICQAAVSFEKWFGIAPDISDDFLRTIAATLEQG